jgi:hypothetical protein
MKYSSLDSSHWNKSNSSSFAFLGVIDTEQCVKSMCIACTYAHQKFFMHILHHQKYAHFAHQNFYFCAFSAQWYKIVHFLCT